jgi:hypothetical protein
MLLDENDNIDVDGLSNNCGGD